MSARRPGPGRDRAGLGPIRRRFQPWTDPAAPAFIEFRGVSKRFGSFIAVDDQSLTIYEREFHALLGPSG